MSKRKTDITIHSSAAEYLTYVASVGDSNDSFEMRYEDENIWLTQKMLATLYLSLIHISIAKGTLPIIGVTKVSQVEDAASAANLDLSDDEIQALEALGDHAGLNVIRYWEKKME